MPEMRTIYALSDPRTGEIRYVGRTTDLDKRMRQHVGAIARKDSPLAKWLKDLRKAKVKPVATELAHVWTDGHCAIETMTISLISLGRNLVNVNQTGFFPAHDADRIRQMEILRERNEQIVHLHLNRGKLMTEIGKIFGLTHERVRQILREAGVTPEESARARRVLWACDHCGDESYLTPYEADLRQYCSRRCATDAGAFGRASTYTKDTLLRHLRDLAGELGHTPGVNDLIDADGPSHSTFYHHFGTLRKAQVLAGLVPNERGRPAHRINGQAEAA